MLKKNYDVKLYISLILLINLIITPNYAYAWIDPPNIGIVPFILPNKVRQPTYRDILENLDALQYEISHGPGGISETIFNLKNYTTNDENAIFERLEAQNGSVRYEITHSEFADPNIGRESESIEYIRDIIVRTVQNLDDLANRDLLIELYNETVNNNASVENFLLNRVKPILGI